MIKISVIIPVYNAEKYVEKCLDTVCNQTIPSCDYEIIAVNDGSTDKSTQLIQNYVGKYKNFIMINQENRGASSARNTGIDIARGKYLSFVDADDWVEPNMLEVLWQTAERYDADIVFFNLFRNENEKMQAYLRGGLYDRDAVIECIYPRLISSTNTKKYGSTIRAATWCKFFRRSLIENNKIRYNERLVYNEDALFSIEATVACSRYVYLDNYYLYHNRVNGDSITKSYINNLWEIQKPMVEELKKLDDVNRYDFSQQINKKMMNIGIYSIENEIKTRNVRSFRDRISTIRSIINDYELRNCISKISVKDLRRIEIAYLICIKHKLSLCAYLTAKYRHKNNEFYSGRKIHEIYKKQEIQD